MKRFFSLILIGAFLFPAFGHASAAPTSASKTAQTTTPEASQTSDTTPIIVKTTDINTQFKTILASLTNLAKQTQDATDQLNLNGIDTTKAQTTLDSAKIAISKAKITLDTQKYSQKIAQTQLQEIKNDILQSLNFLKAGLPTLNQAAQQ